jgi:hypothetical protein
VTKVILGALTLAFRAKSLGFSRAQRNCEWAVSRRYMSLETLAALCDDPQVSHKAIPAA